MLNTIKVEQGDRICVNSIKDVNKRGKALKVQAVLQTPASIQDILFSGQENPGPLMMSE
jgi:hypothetical protein